MLDLLRPYLLYIKLAVYAVAIISVAWTTHEWDRRGYEAQKARDISTAAANYEKSVAEYKNQIFELQQKSDEAVGKYQSKIANLATDNQKLTRKIANATKNQPTATFTVGFGGVWNDSINRANGQGVPAGTPDTEGATDADRAVADITRADLLTNHDAVMQMCGKWKAQLASIIEWDAKVK